MNIGAKIKEERKLMDGLKKNSLTNYMSQDKVFLNGNSVKYIQV